MTLASRFDEASFRVSPSIGGFAAARSRCAVVLKKFHRITVGDLSPSLEARQFYRLCSYSKFRLIARQVEDRDTGMRLHWPQSVGFLTCGFINHP